LQKGKIITIVFLCALLPTIYFFRIPLLEGFTSFYSFCTDRDQIRTFIGSFGPAAPLVFMLLQISQVVFAPFPGEATGFIGGYIFGTVNGFVYSSLGLALGSGLNLLIGRFLGERYIRKLIPSDKFDRFDSFLRKHGVVALFFLFVFPGFPKDYLCLFLGLTTLPVKLLLLLATVGRMPGTLMLSLQGAYLFEENYKVFALVLALGLALIVLVYRVRGDLYTWLDKLNGRR